SRRGHSLAPPSSPTRRSSDLIQADLLGAWALGIRHILAVTGDPPTVGNYPHASAVYDVDSIGLVRILQTLNRGHDLVGNPIGVADRKSTRLNSSHVKISYAVF